MSGQSPARNRRAQLAAGASSVAQSNVRREASPSPTLRDREQRQRYVRQHSLPVAAPMHELSEMKDAVVAATGVSPASTGLPPTLGYPRPITRVTPQFLAHADKWQTAEEMTAEILQQHQANQPPAPGTEGVAYAGGAGGVNYARSKATQAVSSAGSEVVDSGSATNGRRRASASEQGSVSQAQSQPQHRASPLSYAIHKASNSSPGHPSVPSPRSTKNRTPDRSLPVQEEPDDHEQPPRHAAPSPAPSSDINPTKDLDHDAEGTLVDLGDDDVDPTRGEDLTEGENSHTPRSPTSVLFEQEHAARGIHEVLQPDKPAVKSGSQGHKTSFNAADFQQTVKKLQGDNPPVNINGSSTYPSYAPPPPPFSRNESRGSYPNWIPDFYHNYPEELEYYNEATYMQQLQGTALSTQSSHSHPQTRPDAPIPPTPHSQTSAPTPFQQNGSGAGVRHEPVPRVPYPSFSPAPPGTPYPYPFSHLRRGWFQPPGRVPSSVYDPNIVQEQIRMQMQMFAFNNGAMTDSTLSPASTPYPGMSPSYTPFGAFLNQSRAFARARVEAEARQVEGINGHAHGEDGRLTSVSMRSSPSHLPVSLPPPPRGRGLKKHDRMGNLRGNGTARPRVKPPPRVDSTLPRETSPEPSSGEETAGEGEKFDKLGVNQSGTDSQDWSNANGHMDEEDGEWVDIDSEDEEDFLDLEFHPTYVTNIERRRKRWEQKWDDLVRAFQALDRETDTTLVLLAAPSHINNLYSVTSRSIQRDASLSDTHSMNTLRDSFAQIAAQRRAVRTQRPSLLERLYARSTTPSAPGTDGASVDSNSSTGEAQRERDEDWRKLLRTMMQSLSALKDLYDMREARWREEEYRMRSERETMELLISQAFGHNHNIPGQPPMI